MNQTPIFQSIFVNWPNLPPVMHKHYANRAFSNDRVTAVGKMKVETSALARLLSPFLWMTGTLAPRAGDNISVTVDYKSEKNSDAFCLDRIFYYPNLQPYHYHSRMIPIGGNEIIEYSRAGVGWHAAYHFQNGKVELQHIGYRLRLFGIEFPLPLALLIGKGYAEEQALGDESFQMKMEIRHPIFGLFYAYSGTFNITEICLND